MDNDMIEIYLSMGAYIICFLFLLSLFIPSANIFFHFAILKRHRKIRYEVEYYRDVLVYSPSEILYIYNRNYRNNRLDSYGLIVKYQKLFYINLLKMYLLGYIKIDFSKGDNFEIIKKDVLILDKEYKMIYDYIFNVITKEQKIMLYDINNYVEENYKNDSFFKEWHKLIVKSLSMCGFYSTDFITAQGDIMKKYYIFVFVVLALLDLYLLITIPSLGVFCLFVFPLLVIVGYYESKNIRISSNRSIYEYKKIKALKKFLKDFTIIEERPPEYVKLLEDYIVYAAIFDMYDLSIEETLKEIRLFLKVNNQ